MRQRIFAVLVFLLSLYSSPLLGQTGTEAICPDCNIILISLNCFRPDHLGFNGYPKGTSPNLDKLVQNSVVFDRFIVQSFWTNISMGSIFTSQYPSINGYNAFSAQLNPFITTLPEVLRSYGYKTALFCTQGNHYQIASFGQMDPKVQPLLRGFETYQVTNLPAISSVPVQNLGDGLFKWLSENKKNKFFLWLPLGISHYPYGNFSDAEFRRKTIARFGPASPDCKLDSQTYYYDGHFYNPPGHLLSISTGSIQQSEKAYIAGYDASIYMTDKMIADLLDELKRLKLLSKTILIIQGIHGEGLGEHKYYHHYDIYNTEIVQTLLITHPQVNMARRFSKPISGLDLAPTILEMAGAVPMHNAQGKSLVKYIVGTDTATPNDVMVFSERVPLREFQMYYLGHYKSSYYTRIENALNNGWKLYNGDTCVQDQQWKLIHRRSWKVLPKISQWGNQSGRDISVPEYELYELTNDPTEQTNVADQYPMQLQRLKSALIPFEEEIDAANRRRELNQSTPLPVMPYP
jgi:arylsulfatase A-like enzyme